MPWSKAKSLEPSAGYASRHISRVFTFRSGGFLPWAECSCPPYRRRALEVNVPIIVGPSRESIVPKVWTDFYKQTHIPAATKVGDTLRLTGHTGETPGGAFSSDAELQIRQMFLNIAATLAEAGAKWPDVVEINSYHIGLLDQSGAILSVVAEPFVPPQEPA